MTERERKLGITIQTELPYEESPMQMGQDEMNLVEWPFFVLGDQAKDARTILVPTRTTDRATGKVIEGEWLVRSAGPRLPNDMDLRVYVTLMELTYKQRARSQFVYFTRAELCRKLGWQVGGKNYKLIEESLTRLKEVVITATNAFRDRRGRIFKLVGFSIIDDFAIARDREGEGGPGETFIKWSDVVYNSLLDQYTMPLNAEFLRRLPSGLTQLLYRYLAKKRWSDRRIFEVGLENLCFNHLGMPSSYARRNLKSKVKKMADTLVETGFLEAYQFDTMAGGTPKIVFIFPERKEEEEPPALPAPPKPGWLEAEELLERATEADWEAAKVRIRQKLPRAKEERKAFQSALKEEVARIIREREATLPLLDGVETADAG